MVYWFDISIEIISLVIGLIGLFYLITGSRFVDHKMSIVARFFLLAYIFFILGGLISVFNINISYYKSIPYLLSIICFTLAMWYLNKEFRNIVNHHKRKK